MQTSLGEIIAHLRRQRRLTQRQLAGERFSKSYVSAVEHNRNCPRTCRPAIAFCWACRQERVATWLRPSTHSKPPWPWHLWRNRQVSFQNARTAGVKVLGQQDGGCKIDG